MNLEWSKSGGGDIDVGTVAAQAVQMALAS